MGHHMAQQTKEQKKKTLYDQYFSGDWKGDTRKEYGKESVGVTPEDEQPKSSQRKEPTKKKKLIIDTGKTGAIAKAERQFIEKQLELQDREREKREAQVAHKKMQKQRKKKSRAIMKRTKKGQPVMSLQVNQLLQKIEKQTK